MTGVSLLPIFLVGLAGSIHCVGMCGGIVGALSVAGMRAPSAPPARHPRDFPVAVTALRMHAAAPAAPVVPAFDAALRVLAYNGGRIGSYAVAGALAGGMAGGVRALADLSALQTAGYWLANLMLVALGLWLMDAWRGLARIEAVGAHLWRRIQPYTARLLPVDTPSKMLVAGALWGWLPCGMVYSMLMTATLTGAPGSGATVMAVFGLGTLPMLLALGLAGQRVRVWLQRPAVRKAGGLVVFAFGILGLARAGLGLPPSWLDALCLVPEAAH